MSDNNDLIKLYSKQILALAADIPLTGRLDHPSGTCKKRAPLCGSTVQVDVVVEGGKIAEFAQNVRACALGQASASILGRNVIGMGRDDIQTARDTLENMLKNDGPTPGAPFDGLEVLRPAREFKNRHASILLAWEATLNAFDMAAETQAC
ncbi:MAG TPA: iron-sulfur cluster assembly scaffold protein, partial [Aliiroseovarius sp.]|nr:iron-sulfur cluster assembly scaffold protein [Aliiroseovarius sp.]